MGTGKVQLRQSCQEQLMWNESNLFWQCWLIEENQYLSSLDFCGAITLDILICKLEISVMEKDVAEKCTKMHCFKNRYKQFALKMNNYSQLNYFLCKNIELPQNFLPMADFLSSSKLTSQTVSSCHSHGCLAIWSRSRRPEGPPSMLQHCGKCN